MEYAFSNPFMSIWGFLFRPKNYSAEYGRDENDGIFVAIPSVVRNRYIRNFVLNHTAEEKKVQNPVSGNWNGKMFRFESFRDTKSTRSYSRLREGPDIFF